MAGGIKYLVKEVPLDGSAHRRMWIVDIDSGKNFCYRGRTSSNAFFHGGKERNRHNGILYYGGSLDEAISTDEISQKFGAKGIDWDNVPEVDSIFDFYEIIGYDYKKKKYTGGDV